MRVSDCRAGEHGGIFFRLISLLILAALIFLFYLVRRPILREMGEFWIVEGPVSNADALIILGDDNLEGSRAGKAAELYSDHLAPAIVASGRMLRPYAGIGELMERDLTDRGVPASAITVFRHTAGDTIDEAQALRGLVVQKGWRHVIVVTSSYHTRRARYIFSKVFPTNVQVDVAGARDPDYDPSDWWQHKADLRIFLHEAAGMCEAIWLLRHFPQAEGTQTTMWRSPKREVETGSPHQAETPNHISPTNCIVTASKVRARKPKNYFLSTI